jgi:hypothetical protein
MACFAVNQKTISFSYRRCIALTGLHAQSIGSTLELSELCDLAPLRISGEVVALGPHVVVLGEELCKLKKAIHHVLRQTRDGTHAKIVT